MFFKNYEWQYELDKLTFSNGKLYANLGKFFFLVKKAVKFKNLHISRILNTDTNNFFKFLSSIVHFYETYIVPKTTAQ